MSRLAPVFYWLLSRGATHSIPPNAGAFSILRTPMANLVVRNSNRNPYFPGLRAWIGFRQSGIDLHRDNRIGGRSKIGWLGLLRLSLRALTLYTDLLFYFSTLLGGAIIIGTSIISFVLFALRLTGYITIPGATTIVILILLSLGITVLFLGIVAHLVKRVGERTGNQDIFVVMESMDIE